jgi:hypothetical protein
METETKTQKTTQLLLTTWNDLLCAYQNNKRYYNARVFTYLQQWNKALHEILPLTTIDHSFRLRQTIVHLLDLKDSLLTECLFCEPCHVQQLDELLEELYICPDIENYKELLTFWTQIIRLGSSFDFEKTLPPLVSFESLSDRTSFEQFYYQTFANAVDSVVQK